MYSIERIAAAGMLVMLSPVFVGLAIVITVLSRTTPFVRHARVGWRGKPLGMLKFRTMWTKRASAPGTFSGREGRALKKFASPRKNFRLIEDVSGFQFAPVPGIDKRVRSRFAAWCRRYSLDELPQLLHVVTGEMSLVGPRPITRSELDIFYGNCADEVLSLRPGLTGLWQVTGRKHLTYSTRRRLDRLLVRNASYSLYLTVLARSIPCVLTGRGAW